MTDNRKQHWENIYKTKTLEEVSWYQSRPETSLQFITASQLPKAARIIDMGGGDSFFADYLLASGFENITVLDISEAAIERAKARLGDNARKIKWIIADASDFHPTEQYDFWHDRAAFHFLTDEDEINRYIQTAAGWIAPNGILVIGTFSEQGPEKCSGITIKQYSEQTMVSRFETYFEKINCLTTNHTTPFGTIQHFVFCSFRRKE